MGFSNAFYISKTGTKTLSDGTQKVCYTDEYKKYHLLRMASLFGLNISKPDPNSNTIMLFGQNEAMFINGNKMPDSVFINNVTKLKEIYNNRQINLLKKVDRKNSYKYQVLPLEEGMTAEDAYPEADPQVYLNNLYSDLLVSDPSGKRAEKLKNNVQIQINSAINLTRTTSWGKTISQSLEKYWEYNKDQAFANNVAIERE